MKPLLKKGQLIINFHQVICHCLAQYETIVEIKDKIILTFHH